MEDIYEGATQQCSQHDIPEAKAQVSVSVDPDVILVLSGTRGTTDRFELKPVTVIEHGKLVTRREWTFGRGKDAHFKLATSKRRISQLHFCVWATSDEPPVVMIYDNSTNGTYINGVKLVKNKNSMLVHGDTITVGNGVPEDEMEFVCLFSRAARAPASEGIAAKYELAELIGSGAFAKVRIAVERTTGKRYAVKIIEKSRIHGNIAVEREIDVLKRLRHENIVGLVDFSHDTNFYYLVMEYVPEGDLMAVVERDRFIDEGRGRDIMRQILLAIAYVHDMGVSHRDIKPENILVQSLDPVKVKITDFGLAKFSAQNSFLKTFCGTLSYLAPEVLQNRNNRGNSAQFYSNRVDMWSIGCLAYVILTGYMPFDGNTQEDLYRGVLSGQFNPRPVIEAGLSTECQDFIRSLLNVDPLERSDAVTALQHPWIMGELAPSVEALVQYPQHVGDVTLAQSSMSLNQRFTQGLNLERNLTSSQFLPPPTLEPENCDSDEDSYGRFPPSRPDYVGVRSGYENMDDMDGVWMLLTVQPHSRPFKDIGISTNKLSIGRSPESGFRIEDTRISKLHCIIERTLNKNDVYEVWFSDLSRSTCAVNGQVVGVNNRCRIYDDDEIALYCTTRDGKIDNLSFSVKILDLDGTRSKRPQADLQLEPLAQTLKRGRTEEPMRVTRARTERSVMQRNH